MIALLLEAGGILDARLLYLSLHFKRHQQEYYRRLDAVRLNGDWEGWIKFFLEGICTSSEEAIQTSQHLFHLYERDRKRLLASPKVVIPAIRLFEELPSHPVLTINQVVKLLKTTKPTAAKAVDVLTKLGVLEETTGAKRNRMFGYKKYLALLKRRRLSSSMALARVARVEILMAREKKNGNAGTDPYKHPTAGSPCAEVKT